jgi:aminobenzoyl-glutamate utilization protein B
VTTGAGGMPTAIVAEWGSGKPVIGFLAEYDALSNVSQKPVPDRDPVIPNGPGHGCGHNLLGAAALGAAIGLKHEMEQQGMAGTVRFYGCPAEENLSGKAFMARDGVFGDCDAALTWHPAAINRVRTGSSLANNAAYFTFYGRAAHAAGDPYNGRSALDAVQLMNMGVEFLREHMPPKSRAHYVITNGGGQPNVVPPEAQVWYLVRAARRDAVDDLWERIIKCANGAAEMTETTYRMELLKAIYNVLNNRVLEDVLDESFKRVGAPRFSAEDVAFAEAISKSVPAKQKENALREGQVPEEWWDKHLNDEVLERPTAEEEPRGSTDVGDVSWCCPTAQIATACQAMGTPGHSWQYTAQAGMSIGHKGMLTAAKVLAEAGYVLMTSPDTLAKARAEFEKRTEGKAYKCAMPPEQKPAFHVFAKKEK